MSCICSSLPSSLCRGGPRGIVVLVCVPRSVLSTWQFSASRQGGKSILSDLWRCPWCNNNTAQRRAQLMHLTHPQPAPPGPRQGAPSTLNLTPSYFHQGPVFHFNTPFLSILFFSFSSGPPTECISDSHYFLYYAMHVFIIPLDELCLCCYCTCVSERELGVCVECDLYRDKRVDQRGPQRTEQSGSGYILLCGPTNVRCGGR